MGVTLDQFKGFISVENKTERMKINGTIRKHNSHINLLVKHSLTSVKRVLKRWSSNIPFISSAALLRCM